MKNSHYKSGYIMYYWYSWWYHNIIHNQIIFQCNCSFQTLSNTTTIGSMGKEPVHDQYMDIIVLYLDYSYDSYRNNSVKGM